MMSSESTIPSESTPDTSSSTSSFSSSSSSSSSPSSPSSSSTRSPHSCALSLAVPAALPQYIAIGIGAISLVALVVLYVSRERERAANFYGKSDRESRKESAREDEEVMDDELHGRNPAQIHVVRRSEKETGVRVFTRKQSQRCSSGPSSGSPKTGGNKSDLLSASSLANPRILEDYTARGFEITDLLSKNGNLLTIGKEKFNDALVWETWNIMQTAMDKHYVVVGLREGDRPIVHGVESLVNMQGMHLRLAFALGPPRPIVVRCYEVDVGDHQCSEKEKVGMSPGPKGMIAMRPGGGSGPIIGIQTALEKTEVPTSKASTKQRRMPVSSEAEPTQTLATSRPTSSQKRWRNIGEQKSKSVMKSKSVQPQQQQPKAETPTKKKTESNRNTVNDTQATSVSGYTKI